MSWSKGRRGQWSAEGILKSDDVTTLGNGTRLPLVTAMNCFNSFFHHLGSPALGEVLVLEPSGGAIAYWGPTGVSSNLQQKELAESFYSHLFEPLLNPGQWMTVGQAIRFAKVELAEDPKNHQVITTWILLGDPALKLR